MTTQPNQSLSDERNFRPKTLEDFIGQGDLKKTLRLMLDSAHQRSTALEHVVFYGGTGETPSLLDGSSGIKIERPMRPYLEKYYGWRIFSRVKYAGLGSRLSP